MYVATLLYFLLVYVCLVTSNEYVCCYSTSTGACISSCLCKENCRQVAAEETSQLHPSLCCDGAVTAMQMGTGVDALVGNDWY